MDQTDKQTGENQNNSRQSGNKNQKIFNHFTPECDNYIFTEEDDSVFGQYYSQQKQRKTCENANKTTKK